MKKRMINMTRNLLILALPVALFGCGGKVGEVLSLNTTLPDEFAVVTRKPLILPPDFTLRPPTETLRDSKVAITDPRSNVRSLLGFEETSGQYLNLTNLSDDDLALIDTVTGGQETPANIRQIVDQESTDLTRENRTFVKEILGFIIDPEPVGTVIDPNSAQREVNTQTLVNTEDSDPAIVFPQAITTVNTPGVSIMRKEDTTFDWSTLWPF